MKINFIYSPDVSLEQMIGYEMAAIIWGQLFTDDIEVNILAKTTDQLDANVIGGAIPEFHEQHYALFLQYFEADITSADDQAAYDALQQGNTVDFLLNGDLIGGNTKLKLTTALAKALGMDEAISLDRYVLDDAANFLDGTIMMNQDFTWDFNYLRDSETAENTLDFLSVALHETGHILGFTSSLDYSLQQETLYSGRTELSNFTPLDLFRFSAASLAQNNPDGTVNDLSIGGTAWFSTDGGETLSAKMSTGKEGDGYQASHWERRYDPLGIMDPTLWYQERASITDLDVLAFDIMGYDLADHAGDVENLFTTEGLELVLAQAKVQLANKLGVSVEWLENNANVPVSSLDLIAQMEAAMIAPASETTPESTATETTPESTTTETTPESTTTETTPESTTTETTPDTNSASDFIQNLGAMMQGIYQWWSQNNQGGSSSWQELYEWWAQNNQGGSSSWQELYEWWAQNNQGGSSSWQELYEWWAQNNQGGSSSWQELYEWWSEDNQGNGSWWQQVFFASTEEASLENIQLPGQNNTTIEATYKEISGGNQDDILGGDITNDNIIAGEGDDLIDGAEGDDTIAGGEGYDTIFGFDGNDSVMGGAGDDVISGESDNDVLLGEDGADVLMGGDHDDYLDGGVGRDFLNGNTGHDVLIGGAGDDALEGEAGKDLLVGGAGKDIGNGGSGDDFIFGDEYSASLQQAFGSNVNSLINLFTPNTDTTTTDTTTTTETNNVVLGLDPLKVEAEDMTLSGNFSLAASGTLVQTNSNTASLSTVFNGEAGKYNIVIGYHDVYGNARINASLGTNTIDNWYLNQTSNNLDLTGSNFKTRTIASEVMLNGGESLILDTTTYVSYSGDDDDDSAGIVYDKAYIDYIEFVPIVDNTNNVVLDPDPNTSDPTTTDPNTSDPTTTNPTTPEVTLGANSDILRGGNGNDGIDGGVGNDVIFGEDEFNDSSNIAPLNIDGSFTYGQSTYLLTQKATTWKEAQAIAQSYGGNLVTINDAAEEAWLKSNFGSSETFWLGINDVETEGEMKWVSGETVTYTNWKSGQPNNYGNNEDYGIMYTDGQWYDTPGTNTYRGIIEIDWSSVGGNDTILGGAGNDQIYGNSGNDQIYGDNTANFTTAEIVKTPKNLTFQQGVNGYNGTVDTILKETSPNNSFSNATSLQVDIDSQDHFQSLIRFDDIFGDELGKIALYDTIDSAILEIDVSNSGDSIAVHQMLQSWSDSATWNSLVNGISANGVEATSTAIVTTGSVSTGILSIDVTESLKAWQANPNSNHGWAFLPTGTADVFFDSAEGSNAPRLTVDVNQASSQSLTVNVNQTSSQNLTFQQGVDGYTGTVDTQLHGYNWTTNYGNATSLNIDGNDLGYPVQSLIKFEDIFGSQTSQIAQDATINSAILEIDVSDPGSGFKVHELLKNWSESTTWYSWNEGVSANGIEAATNAVATTGSVSTGILQIDVTESLKAWQADPTKNYGWALIATGSDGVDFDSSEGVNAPRLVVDVTQEASASDSISGEGNDNITGNGGNDTISGGAGDDVINGTDEIVAGYYEKDVLVGGAGADKFILGDANQAYYATVGYQDYAVIEDFDSSVDKIQLHGSAIDYQQQQQSNDLFLSRHGDLVAILENTKSVNLNSSGFEYVSTI